jgi:hypothetical protein
LRKKARRFYKATDWYRAYVEIKAQDMNKITNPFPLITICENVFKAAYDELKTDSAIAGFIEEFINFPMVKEVILAGAHGVTQVKINGNKKAIGESIHCFQYEVTSLKAFRKITTGLFMGLRKRLKMHYREYGLTDNLKMPTW